MKVSLRVGYAVCLRALLVLFLFGAVWVQATPNASAAAVCVTNGWNGVYDDPCPIWVELTPYSSTVPYGGNTNIDVFISGILQYEVRVDEIDIWVEDIDTGVWLDTLSWTGTWPSYGGTVIANTGSLTRSVKVVARVMNRHGVQDTDSVIINVTPQTPPPPPVFPPCGGASFTMNWLATVGNPQPSATTVWFNASTNKCVYAPGESIAMSIMMSSDDNPIAPLTPFLTGRPEGGLVSADLIPGTYTAQDFRSGVNLTSLTHTNLKAPMTTGPFNLTVGAGLGGGTSAGAYTNMAPKTIPLTVVDPSAPTCGWVQEVRGGHICDGSACLAYPCDGATGDVDSGYACNTGRGGQAVLCKAGGDGFYTRNTCTCTGGNAPTATIGVIRTIVENPQTWWQKILAFVGIETAEAVGSATIDANDIARVSWSSTDADSCEVLLDGSDTVDATRATSGGPRNYSYPALSVGAHTFTIDCTGPTGSASDSVTVTVTAPVAPTLSLFATPASLPFGGGTARIAWNSTGATSCDAWNGDASWDAYSPATGTQYSDRVVSTTTTYTMECWNSVGVSSGVQNVTVTVSPPPVPTLSLTASNTSLPFGGGNTRITWTTANATFCDAWNGDASWDAYNPSHLGSFSDRTVSTTTTYTMECWNSGGVSTGVRSVVVTTAPPASGTLTISPNTCTILAGQSTCTVPVTWNIINGSVGNLYNATRLISYPGPTGSNVPVAITNGVNIMQVRELVTVLNVAVATASCVGGTAWDGARCVLPPTLAFSANPLALPFGGGNTEFSWTVANATWCYTGGWPGGDGFVNSANGTWTATRFVSTSATFSLQCGNSATGIGTGQRWVTISVVATPPPDATAFMEITPPTPIPQGNSITLTWTTTNADSCWGSSTNPGWDGWKNPAGGSQVVTPIWPPNDYSIECWNSTGGSAGPWSVMPNIIPAGPPGNVMLTAFPPATMLGDSATIRWDAMNSTSCWASGGTAGWGGWKNPLPIGTQVVTPLVTTTYTMQCWNSAGQSMGPRNIMVTVTPPPIPSVMLNSNPPVIAWGSSANLDWSTTMNPTSCMASDGWVGPKNVLGGTEAVSPVVNTTYTIECFNSIGQSVGPVSTMVWVDMPPDARVDINATPAFLTEGSPVTLDWTTTDATACWGSGGSPSWDGWKDATGGSEVVTPDITSTPYTIECWNAVGGSMGPATAWVNVSSVPAVASVWLDPVPATITVGQSVDLHWYPANADSCWASDGWTGWKSKFGGTEVLSPVVTTTYTIECWNTLGQSAGPASTVVTVNPASPSGSVSLSGAPGCAIATGSSTCNVNFTWNITNATAPELYNVDRGNPPYSTDPAGTNIPFPITHGSNTVLIRDGGVALGPSVVATATCDNPLALWNGICELPCVRTAFCGAESSATCTGSMYDISDSCGTYQCPGTRSCNYNWKEIAP